MADDVERRIDDLYQLPPEEFTAARNALAKEVRSNDRTRGEEIKALRKPTVAAHGLNAAAREDPQAIVDLRDAGRAVQDAQEAVLAGDRGMLREATERRRAIIARLTDAATSAAGDAYRDDIEATLEAASVDDELHARLAAGRLQSTTEARAGFGDLAGLLAASASTPAQDAAGQRRQAEAQRLRDRIADADADVEHAAGEAERAEDRLASAEEALEAARRRLDEATAQRDQLAAQLAELDRD